eukprot:2215586-Prymnesium_polylepis.1
MCDGRPLMSEFALSRACVSSCPFVAKSSNSGGGGEGGGGILHRSPQSKQSLANVHDENSLPGPPSSHTPSALALTSIAVPSTSKYTILQSSSQQPATVGVKGGRVGGSGGSGG